jgi:hypothetical protein
MYINSLSRREQNIYLIYTLIYVLMQEKISVRQSINVSINYNYNNILKAMCIFQLFERCISGLVNFFLMILEY